MSDIKVKVSSDTSQFQRSVSQMERSLNGLKNVAIGVGGAMAFGAAANMLGRAASFAVDFAKSSSQAAMAFDAMKISIRTLVGDADKADTLMKNLREFGATTPLQTKDINEAAKTLLNFRVNADKIMPVLENLGDVSLGDADKLQRMARVFGQVSSASRMTMEDVNQLIDAGFSPLDYISQATGRSVESLRDDASKGKLTIGDLAFALDLAAGKGEKLNGALKKLADTPAGALSNLEDTITSIKETFGAGLNVGLMDLFKKGSEFGTTMLDDVKKIGEEVGRIITLISNNLPATVTKLKEDITKSGGVFSYLKTLMANIINSVLEDPRIKAQIENIIKYAKGQISSLVPAGTTAVLTGMAVSRYLPTRNLSKALAPAKGQLGGSLIGAGITANALSNLNEGDTSALNTTQLVLGGGLLATNIMNLAKTIATWARAGTAATVATQGAATAITTIGTTVAGIGTAISSAAAAIVAAPFAGMTAASISQGEGPLGWLDALDVLINGEQGYKAGRFLPPYVTGKNLTLEAQKQADEIFAQIPTSPMVKESPTLQSLFSDFRNFQTPKEGFWKQFAPAWAFDETVKAPWEMDPEKGMGAKITRTLTRVGGGGAMFSGGVINLQREANKILNKIENNTKNFTPSWN